MYVLQFCNTFTQEILRQETYEKPNEIEGIIEGFSSGNYFNTYLLDDQLRILRADYVTYKVYPVENDMLYKLFFRILSVESQLKI